MHKSIITSIAKKADITWHLPTQNLYKSFLDAYDAYSYQYNHLLL